MEVKFVVMLSLVLMVCTRLPDRGASLLERIASEEGCEVIVSGTGWAVAKLEDR
jgi:hypothetical protein